MIRIDFLIRVCVYYGVRGLMWLYCIFQIKIVKYYKVIVYSVRIKGNRNKENIKVYCVCRYFRGKKQRDFGGYRFIVVEVDFYGVFLIVMFLQL